MKLFYLLLLISGLGYLPTLQAQEWIQRIPTIRFSGHGNYNAKYPKASKVHIKRYNHYEIFNEWDTYYNYSKDSLTLIIGSGTYVQTAKYDSDGKMISFSSPINEWNDTYTYTDDGKILKIEGKRNTGEIYSNIFYEYTNDSATEIYYGYSEVYNKLIPFEKNIIKYTDTPQMESFRYDMETNEWQKEEIVNYTLDYLGRITEITRFLVRTDYTSYIHYEYTDDGYIVFERRNNSKDINKTEYIFNDKDDIKKIKEYRYGDLYSIEDYTYTYLIPTANDEVKTIHPKVYSRSHNLIIENPGTDNIISIYSITGQLLKKLSTSKNVEEIPLKAGIYIISIGNKTYKIKIK